MSLRTLDFVQGHLERLLPTLVLAALASCVVGSAAQAQPNTTQDLDARLERLEREIESAEDVSAIKRLQRAYGYYLDKGLWQDLSELFAEDAVANYPVGVFVGRESIAKHLYLNVGGGELGEVGLPDGRLYNHMVIQPVVHLGADGKSAVGRWRVVTMLGTYGESATWADGIYQVSYVEQDGIWRIKTLDYWSSFAAPYETGWVRPEETADASAARRAANLGHSADRPRDMPCKGFPQACIVPFHYANPGTPEGGNAWVAAALGAGERSATAQASAGAHASVLERRAQRLADEIAIENLQRIYGYYYDRRMWDEIAALFAARGTIEMGLSGVYVGSNRVREFLELLGRAGIDDGELNDRVQLQIVVDVAPDGRTAKARSRELAMIGVHGRSGQWAEGIYENAFVKENGVWKIAALRYFPTFAADYDAGWARDAQAPLVASATLLPDAPPTSVYEIYPRAHIPPFHYDNPVTLTPPRYPAARGRPAGAAIAAVRAPVVDPGASRTARLRRSELEASIVEAETRVARAKDFHELENLESAYGYYLDKNLWNDLADLFAAEGSMELAHRGKYVGRERVRGFLFAVFGDEGPVEGRLGNHLQWQPVIHIADDGTTAQIRSRMLQQLSFDGRPSLGAAIYTNAAVKEDGVWKLARVHAFNTWTADYVGGWVHAPETRAPGPSSTYPPDAPPSVQFTMFPNVYDIPFHYAHPVLGTR